MLFVLLMIRRPPRSTQSRSSAASDVYKRQQQRNKTEANLMFKIKDKEISYLELGGGVVDIASLGLRLALWSLQSKRSRPVIILDEVQMLSNSILEELRLLFNFKMDSENTYILILSGQSTLRSKLQLSINAPLRQRISIKHSMQGLKKEELNEYISSLLKAAGNTNDIFTPQAIEVIYSLSKGVPRLINNIAIASLMYGCATKKDFIDEEAVYQGQKDFEL